MVGDRFSSSTSCSGWLHETAPARPDPALSCLFFESCNTSSQRAPVVMRQWLSRSYRRTARVTASAREIPGVRVCSASMSRSTWAALPKQMWRSRVSARRAPPLRPAAHHTTSPTVATSTSTATVSTSNSILATSPGCHHQPVRWPGRDPQRTDGQCSDHRRTPGP